MHRDWTSSEEEPEEEPFEEEEDEEEEEENKKPEPTPIESIKVITTGDRLDFVKGDPIVMGKCGFRSCTIHGPMEESQQIDPKARREHTIGASISVGPPRKKPFATPKPVAKPEVHASSSKAKNDILHEQIKEMETTLAVKTRAALAMSLRIIAKPR